MRKILLIFCFFFAVINSFAQEAIYGVSFKQEGEDVMIEFYSTGETDVVVKAIFDGKEIIVDKKYPATIGRNQMSWTPDGDITSDDFMIDVSERSKKKEKVKTQIASEESEKRHFFGGDIDAEFGLKDKSFGLSLGCFTKGKGIHNSYIGLGVGYLNDTKDDETHNTVGDDDNVYLYKTFGDKYYTGSFRHNLIAYVKYNVNLNKSKGKGACFLEPKAGIHTNTVDHLSFFCSLFVGGKISNYEEPWGIGFGLGVLAIHHNNKIPIYESADSDVSIGTYNKPFCFHPGFKLNIEF